MMSENENLFDVTGKRILITGSGRGIGKHLANTFLEHGAYVILNDIDPDRLQKARDDFREKGYSTELHAFDVTNESEIKKGIEQIVKKHTSIDILINNAGINRRATLLELDEKDWDAVLEVNLKSMFLMSRTVAPIMIKQGGGKIINMASLLSEGARPTIPAYTASKGGVKMLTKSMAIEWAEYNIQVNAIGPGYFKTEMNTALVKDEKFNQWVLESTPARRWGELSDLSGTALFLASRASNFINGQVIYVDGGWLASL